MDLATPTVHKNGNQLFVTHGNDEGLYVEFEKVAIQNNFKSEKEGRPIFEEVDFVNIIFPGDKTKKIVRPVNLEGNSVTPSDPARFPRQWAAFQAQEEQSVSGTPITEWPPITKSQAAELKAMNIHTVEALANLPDSAINFFGARNLREKADLWLKSAKDGSVVTAMQADNENLKSDIEMLKQQIKELSKVKKEKQ